MVLPPTAADSGPALRFCQRNHAIEAKNRRSLRPRDLRGLRTFHGDYPESSPILLYRGDETLERDGVRCVPVDRFLRELIPGRDLLC